MYGGGRLGVAHPSQEHATASGRVEGGEGRKARDKAVVTEGKEQGSLKEATGGCWFPEGFGKQAKQRNADGTPPAEAEYRLLLVGSEREAEFDSSIVVRDQYKCISFTHSFLTYEQATLRIVLVYWMEGDDGRKRRPRSRLVSISEKLHGAYPPLSFYHHVAVANTLSPLTRRPHRRTSDQHSCPPRRPEFHSLLAHIHTAIADWHRDELDWDVGNPAACRLHSQNPQRDSQQRTTAPLRNPMLKCTTMSLVPPIKNPQGKG
ncbi:hypothetical protein DFP72DRAFT_1051580 [Ephemerocybe angulata]|uniref:Uncharacterized protein n=1 Tax=Ephemerocybe angulata TaxID=980116 RepID=A0A8H6HF28_9AGAR|nr:hypothetical protein DFP72DRAFT_1051580 [Tulosesus angulatus]